MKKRLILIAAICLAAALFALPAAADGTITGTCGDGVTWEYSEASKTLTISGNGVIQTRPDFKPNWIIEKIVINEGITAIGDFSFTSVYYSNVQLESVSLPSTLKSIGDGVFSGCAGLEEISLPEGLETIGAHAFSACRALRDIDLPDGLKSIGEMAFGGCGFTSLELPQSLNSIGSSAFAGNEQLGSVQWPSSVAEISSGVFKSCKNLTSIVIPEGVTSIGDRAFMECSSLNNVVFPSSMETVGSTAFCDCSNLTNLELNEGLSKIDDGAFARCGITSITIPGTVSDWGNYYPQGAFSYCSNLKEVIINPGVESLCTMAFEGCSSLQSVAFPGSLKVIEQHAFSGCTNLKSVQFSSKLESIGDYAFCDTAIETVETAAKTIGLYAFGECSNLTSVKLTGATTLDERAFGDCASLSSVQLNDGIIDISANVFDGCSNLKSIVIPDSASIFGGNIFANCTALESVTLGKRITSIPTQTFYNCPSLTSITLPDMVTSIGDEAFSGCSGLETLTVGEFVNSVGGAAFYGCEELTLRVCEGSYMQAYAEAYDIDYELIPGTTEDAVGIASITSARGVDTAGKACTVVTITLTNGETEVFYVYDGEQGEPGEPGEIIIAESFSDVPSGAYYSDAVAWAVAEGITTGTGDGRFSPDAPCTRAQVVTFLWRAMGSPEPAGTAGFADVGAGEYYAKAVRWALEKGITAGTGAGTFSPNAECTRAQVVTFLARALGAAGGGGSGFADVPAGAYYADAVAWAVAEGITTGTGAGTFSPDAGCTRGQIVTFLFRAAA